MLEGEIQKTAIRHARKRGWWCRKFRSAGRRAAPDYILIKDGRVIFIEYKATGERPTELQKEYHEEMRKYGAVVYVCDSIEASDKALYVEEIEF